MEETFSAVEVLIERMNTHPEEFFEGSKGRWGFMYRDYFRDCLAESEKGRIHEALRAVRRIEFDAMVVKELMRDEQAEQRELEKQMKAEAKVQAMTTAAKHGLINGNIQSSNLYNNYQNQTSSHQMGGYGQGLMQPSPFGAVPKVEGDSV